MPSNRILKTTCLLALAATLGACSFNKIDTGVFTQPVEPEGRILVEAPAYSGTTPTRVHYSDSRIFEEYALFRSARGQSEMVFSETNPLFKDRTVIDYDKLISSQVPKWRFNIGQTLKFDESFNVDNDFASFWVQPYRQVENGRECAGFSSRWDTRMDDQQLRPSKVMFGFHCAPKGTSFGAADARAFVKAIQIRGISVPLRVESAYALNKKTPPPAKDVQTTNLVLAQDGAGGGIAGLPEFPLLFARIYNNFDDGGCSNC